MDIKKELKLNNLVYNEHNDIDLIDLQKYILSKKGYKLELSDKFQKLETIIPDNKHYLIVLISGLTSKMLSSTSHIYSLIPTTKCNNLLSLVTLDYPSTHMILGNNMHDNLHNLSYSYESFIDRINNNDIREYGVNEKDIYNHKTVFKDVSARIFMMLPDNKDNYKLYNEVSQGTNLFLYQTTEEAIKKASRIGKMSLKPTITYLFIDALEKNIDVSYILDKVTTNLKLKNTTTIVTSLYGSVRPSTSVILNYSKYNKYFYALPAIENRFTTFYVKDSAIREFKQEFTKDYAGLLKLYKTSDLLKLEILGKIPNNTATIGNYIAIALDNNYLEVPINEEEFIEKLNLMENKNIINGGMSKDEVIVPLIVL